MKKSKKMSVGKKVAVGAGIAALSVGAYYFFGPNSKAHQKKAKVLVAKVKKEVEREVKKAKAVTVPLYHKAVDTVSKNYAKQYKLHEKDVKALAAKVKNEWKGAKKVVKKAVRVAKKQA
ncbi:MAG: hypothetical protein WC870_01390 [Candidatus Paceibacterota bacterium]